MGPLATRCQFPQGADSSRGLLRERPSEIRSLRSRPFNADHDQKSPHDDLARWDAKIIKHGGCSSVGSSARLWFWMSWVQIPPAAPAKTPPKRLFYFRL